MKEILMEKLCSSFFSSFKGTVAWDQPIVERIYTVYLELIAVKPDHIDTSLYALNLRKKIFVEKLGNRYLIACVKIKLLSILYIIKDDNGNHMLGLVVMLAIQHLLNDYWEDFLKKYKNVFVRQIFSKVLTKGNVDSLISCISCLA